jgi:hypothetical protein
MKAAPGLFVYPPMVIKRALKGCIESLFHSNPDCRVSPERADLLGRGYLGKASLPQRDTIMNNRRPKALSY